MVLRFRRFVVEAGAVLCVAALTIGCAPKEATQGGGATAAETPPLPVASSVSIAKLDEGGYDFTYSGEYSDADGDFDFTKVDRPVLVEFTIAPGSLEGLKFKSRGEDALWIAEKAGLAEGASPEGPYRGAEFASFATEADGMRMRVLNRNDDGKLYRYALRFELNGETIADDPDWQNGGGDDD